MILSAYSRGLVSVQTPFIRGSMAAVGLGYKTVSFHLPQNKRLAASRGFSRVLMKNGDDEDYYKK